MLSTVFCRAQLGIDAPEVAVETHIAAGLPRTTIVGLPETAVKESKDRVRSALINSHFEYPDGRITINLAPADLNKFGTRFDLAIALGILSASGQLPVNATDGFECLGELALDGRIRAVTGAVSSSIACREQGRSLLLPADNAAEAALVRGACIIPCQSLLAACAHLRGTQLIEPARADGGSCDDEQAGMESLDDVRGQPIAKRAAAIAAAGGHNLLMCGPPGVGKTMLARRIASLLPPLGEREQLETLAIYSAAGIVRSAGSRSRPFRAPHRTASQPALIGGGSHPRPGELSLAHRGVLFLDELPEWPRKSIELLREPVEARHVVISRVAGHISYPADFQLIAAMNPCPCGYAGSSSGQCRCTPARIASYREQISGPMLDRFDLVCQLETPSIGDVLRQEPGTKLSAKRLKADIERARNRQLQRQGKLNAALETAELARHAALDTACSELLERLATTHRLSIRACHRIMRTARTIADLRDASVLETRDLLEASGYRVDQTV